MKFSNCRSLRLQNLEKGYPIYLRIDMPKESLKDKLDGNELDLSLSSLETVPVNELVIGQKLVLSLTIYSPVVVDQFTPTLSFLKDLYFSIEIGLPHHRYFKISQSASRMRKEIIASSVSG